MGHGGHYEFLVMKVYQVRDSEEADQEREEGQTAIGEGRGGHGGHRGGEDGQSSETP